MLFNSLYLSILVACVSAATSPLESPSSASNTGNTISSSATQPTAINANSGSGSGPTIITSNSSGNATATTTTSSSSSIDTNASNYIALPTPAASGAVAFPGTNGYTYMGCWSETTNIQGAGRALNPGDGAFLADNSLTAAKCLDFCYASRLNFCGLEYGRECWGSQTFSSLSRKLNEWNCSYGCGGNLSQTCGGSLTLNLYNLTELTTGSGASASGSSDKKGGAEGGLALLQFARTMAWITVASVVFAIL